MKKPHSLIPWLTAFCFGILSNTACAQLGGVAANVTATPAPGVVRHAMFNGAAMVRTTIDDGGTTITEYADSTGRIFAYTWRGPTVPDLRALLGRYEDAYRSAASDAAGTTPRTASLHASRVAAGDVIVESSGRMRAYVGRAWLPAALPPGITAADLH